MRTKRGRGFAVKFPVEVEREIEREAKRRGLSLTAWFLDGLISVGFAYSRTRPGISSVRAERTPPERQDSPVEG